MAIPEAPMTGALDVLRLEGIALLQRMEETLGDFGEDAQEDRRRLHDVGRDLRDSFFLVTVVGEFNAGKSTFVNALLGEDLLPTGVTPTTAAIEMVLYAEQPRRTPQIRDDGLREWAHPGTGAPGVALVDTPGTGSVFRSHERLALEFLHRSDLVLFVISARRALAQAGRDYLELAQKYGKKIVIIINQVDQLEPAERGEVRRFVERQARELLNLEPLIFMVSARQSLTNANEAKGQQDGMAALRAHLGGLIAQAPPAQQKLLAQLDMAERIARFWLDRSQQGLAALQADRSRIDEVQVELERQSMGLDSRLQETLARCDQVFAGLRQRGNRFLDENMSLLRWRRGRRRPGLQETFQEEVVGRSLLELEQLAGAYAGATLDQSRLYWRSVIERLQGMADTLEQEPAGLDAGVYAGQRESLQEAIEIARRELETGLSEAALEELRSANLDRINRLAASSLTALGGALVTLLGFAAPGPVLGAGAAALALPAVIVGAPLAVIASALSWRRYRRLTRETREEFESRVGQMQRGMREALHDITESERLRLTQYGKQVLLPVYSRLDVLTAGHQDRCELLQAHLDAIDRLRGDLQQG